MNTRKLTTGFYVPTDSYKSIPEHVAIMFEDDHTLVGVFGASDDDPKNLQETNEYARLFATSPELLKTLIEIEERCEEKMGEWSSVSFAYLPDDMVTLYEVMHAARDAIVKAGG